VIAFCDSHNAVNIPAIVDNWPDFDGFMDPLTPPAIPRTSERNLPGLCLVLGLLDAHVVPRLFDDIKALL
jgi:hypothetical protein